MSAFSAPLSAVFFSIVAARTLMVSLNFSMA
jgi:hypothetical protein